MDSKFCDDFISIAEDLKIGWWATSYLETNVGLNAIAQWISTKHSSLHQGLGTGGIYTKNIPSPLLMKGESLTFDSNATWDVSNILNDE